jgi:hypothetical protein
VKSPSQVGSKQHQIGKKCVILTLSHNTIGIALVDSDGGHVSLVTRILHNTKWLLLKWRVSL